MLKYFRKKKFTLHLKRHMDDLLILAGCGLIVYTTALLSTIIAMYLTGALLIIFGVLVGLGLEEK